MVFGVSVKEFDFVLIFQFGNNFLMTISIIKIPITFCLHF